MGEKTLRDEFAMAALTGVLANAESAELALLLERCFEGQVACVTEAAYRIADAMLAARTQEQDS